MCTGVTVVNRNDLWRGAREGHTKILALDPYGRARICPGPGRTAAIPRAPMEAVPYRSRGWAVSRSDPLFPSPSSWPHCSLSCRGQRVAQPSRSDRRRRPCGRRHGVDHCAEWASSDVSTRRGRTGALRDRRRRGTVRPLKKGGPEFESGGLGAAEVVDSDIDMHVRGPVGRRPRRRNVVRNLLEGDGGPPLVRADHNPVGVVDETAVAEEHFVKGRKVSGRRAVDREALPTADHRAIVDPRSRCSQASEHKAP
jgi:hypothetical protein